VPVMMMEVVRMVRSQVRRVVMVCQSYECRGGEMGQQLNMTRARYKGLGSNHKSSWGLVEAKHPGKAPLGWQRTLDQPRGTEAGRVVHRTQVR
jgi:hypothetical protein